MDKIVIIDNFENKINPESEICSDIIDFSKVDFINVRKKYKSTMFVITFICFNGSYQMERMFHINKDESITDFNQRILEKVLELKEMMKNAKKDKI